MHLVGTWQVRSENLLENAAEEWSLIQKAANENYSPALYEIGPRAIRGEDPHCTPDKGWKMVRDAATLGSVQAQFYLGQAYENGDGVPKEPDRARRYFRLCAARGQSRCEHSLAQLLLEGSPRSEDDYVQAIAWFQLAAEQGDREAGVVVAQEQSNLTPAQLALVKGWKSQLLRK